MFSLKNTKTKRSCRTLSHASTNIKDYFGNNYRIKHWVKNGKIHRLNGPAKISYDDGLKRFERWYENGKLHRLNGPAEIWYYETGLIEAEVWYENGKLHRLNGPAYIEYQDTGLIETEWWYVPDIEQNKKACCSIM